MSYKGVITLEVLEGANNYNAWIAHEIDKYVKSPFLEVGAGLGSITAFFTNKKKFIASDLDPKLVNILKEKFSDQLEDCEVLNIENSIISHKRSYFNSVFSVNVLEHIKNDTQALRNMHAMLREGGYVIALVPANQFAFTRLDRELGHFRRYSEKDLRKKLEEAGFSEIKIKHFNFVGLFAWLIRDKIWRNSKDLHTTQIKLFDLFVPFFRFVESIIPVPNGVSLIAVAKKMKE